MENLPLTEHGMTVFDPGAAAGQFCIHKGSSYLQKAPSIPWSERLGFPVSSVSAAPRNLKLTHSAHEGSDGIIGQSLITSNSALNIGYLEVDLLKLLPLVIGNRGNQVVDSRNQDLSLG
jgi:hypothetical protein